MSKALTAPAAPVWWKPHAAEQLRQLGDIHPTLTHAVVNLPGDGTVRLLDIRESEASALVCAEDYAEGKVDGEVTVAPIADLLTHTTAALDPDDETTDGPTIEELEQPDAYEDDDDEGELEQRADLDHTQAAAAAELGLEPEDPDAGKLFDVPRTGVLPDTSDPTVLKVSFSGSIELDRTSADDVAFYNRLKAGHTVELHVEAHVAGAKTVHRRDSEGDVDAVVQTKSLIVHTITTD